MRRLLDPSRVLSDNKLLETEGFSVQVSGPPLAASVQSDRNRNFWDSVPKSAVIGFRIS